MRQDRVLICDTDTAYVKALGSYLIGSRQKLDISTYTSTEAAGHDRGQYDAALLGSDFLDMARQDSEGRFSHIFYLANDLYDSSDEFPVLYKFQQMGSFLEKLLAGIGRDPKGGKIRVKTSSAIMGIYSPMNHELALPFSLAVCKEIRNRGERVLFVDVQGNSIMDDLTGEMCSKNITDYLYLLESSSDSLGELDDCFAVYNSISYIPPSKHFQELRSVGEDRWKAFFDSVPKHGFDRVVVLFDISFGGASVLMNMLNKLLLLGKEGDYYRLFEGQITRYMNEIDNKINIQKISLPLSGSRLKGGSYRLEQLLEGNLSKYARRALEGDN